MSASDQRYQIALLLGFAKFTRWPDSAFSSTTDPLELCLLGSNALVPTLIRLEGTLVRGRKVKVSVYKRAIHVPEPSECHLFYVANLAQNSLAVMLKLLDGLPVLTLSDLDQFSESGGGVEIVQGGQKKNQFIVNLAVIKRAQLKISAQLLGMAAIVRK